MTLYIDSRINKYSIIRFSFEQIWGRLSYPKVGISYTDHGIMLIESTSSAVGVSREQVVLVSSRSLTVWSGDTCINLAGGEGSC